MVTFSAGAPTMEEMICLYLYDDIKPPAPGTLKSKKDVLALAKPTRQDVEIDKNWFMVHGGGRFVHDARFNIVRNFLARKDNFGAGVYNAEQVFNAYGTRKGDVYRMLGVKQYEYGINDSDFTDRCEVFGSSSFAINKGARFVVNPDGTREIHGIWIEPVNDNYDYESSSWEAKISNTLTENAIDPWRIGRKVVIRFTGNVHSIHAFSERDLIALESRNRTFEALKHSLSIFQKVEAFATLHPEKMKRLYAKGILYAKPVMPLPVGAHLPPLPPVTLRMIARDEEPPLL